MEGDGDRPVTLPPEDLELDVETQILEWDAALDAFDYLTLLGLPDAPSDDEVRQAWHRFALAFHPDRHLDAEPNVRDAATRVFRRGAEAYRVLQDPPLRARYLQLRRAGGLRMTSEQIARSKKEASERIQDLVSSSIARPFAVRADELIAEGNFRQARLQLQLAIAKEPSNEALRKRLEQLEQRISLRPPK